MLREDLERAHQWSSETLTSAKHHCSTKYVPRVLFCVCAEAAVAHPLHNNHSNHPKCRGWIP